jgi:hypothetical protein
MSAFVVNKEHINAMIHAGLARRYRPMTWYHEGVRHELTNETANIVGQMLLDECVKSVCYRYGDSEMTDLPGRINAEWLIPFEYRFTYKRPTPVEALKLIDCYEYQSCEHPEWEGSLAQAFCRSLRGNTIDRLPGYDEAPWEWEDQEYHKVNRPIRLV